MIAIVDDHTLFRNGVAGLMSEFSELKVVFEAGNGQQMQQLLTKHAVPQVILMDINMPVMDGEELLRRMSEHEVLRAIPVVVISTDHSDCRIRRMLSLGAKGYVTKPFTPETLREQLEQSLGVMHATD